MNMPDRELDIAAILNEWNPNTSWRIVKDTEGNLVFMHEGYGRLMTDQEVLQNFLHATTNWDGLNVRIIEAGPVNVRKLLEALYVLTVGAADEAKEQSDE